MSDKKLERATFGAGCFWGSEEAFRNVKGVANTQVGFMRVPDAPTPVEVVEVEYDPEEISYEDLLDAFWSIHDPSTPRERFGAEYQSVVFAHTPEQTEKARAAKKRLAGNGNFRRPIATEITAATKFRRATEDHQQYYEKRRAPRVR